MGSSEFFASLKCRTFASGTDLFGMLLPDQSCWLPVPGPTTCPHAHLPTALLACCSYNPKVGAVQSWRDIGDPEYDVSLLATQPCSRAAAGAMHEPEHKLGMLELSVGSKPPIASVVGGAVRTDGQHCSIALLALCPFLVCCLLCAAGHR